MSDNKPRTRVWILGLGLVVAYLALRFLGRDAGDHPAPQATPAVLAQRPPPNPAPQATPAVVAQSPPPKADDGYRTLLANVNIGSKVYLKVDKVLIGEIVDVKKGHRFPDASVRDAVKINYANGGSDWIPRETAIHLYVTK